MKVEQGTVHLHQVYTVSVYSVIYFCYYSNLSKRNQKVFPPIQVLSFRLR